MIKIIYNLDDTISASTWIRKETKGKKTYDAPQLSSAMRVKDRGRGKLLPDNIGYMVNASNNIYENAGQVAIFSSACTKGNGFSVIPENFYKVTTLFVARKMIQRNWANWTDEYMEPLHD